MVTPRPDRDTLCAHRGCVGGLGGLGPQAAVLGVEGGDAVAQAALLRPAALRGRRVVCLRIFTLERQAETGPAATGWRAP